MKKNFLIKINNFMSNSKYEEKKMLKIFNQFSVSDRILDVGCGYGKYIKLLKKKGFDNVIGVDINDSIIKKNRENGINCFNSDDFFNKFKTEKFDVILMAHVIEHFAYDDLKNFLEKYLEILKNDGSLIIITPLMSKFFYIDFDHVKPYDPVGLSMFFSDNAQMQFYSKVKLKLENLYFRRSPFRIKNLRSLYVKKNSIPFLNKLPGLINFILAVLFKFSGGLVGYASGWIGEYKKHNF